MTNKRGFTLIELLAVITIMGILMMLATMTISRILEDSRKQMYINTAKTYIRTLKSDVNEGRYDLYDTDTSYYIHINNIEMENETQSPYAPWETAYVVIGSKEHGKDKEVSYEYAWASKDTAGWRVDLQAEDKLSKRDVYNDKKRALNYRAPFGSRNKVVIIGPDGNITNASQVVEMTKEEADKCYSYEFIEADKSVKITYYKKECGPDVAIPGIIDGYTVKEIYQYTFYNMGLNSVIIPGTVTTIGTRAFANNKLTKVVLPQGLITIDSEAFMNNQLPDVAFPNTLKTIGARSFKTNQLTTYNIPNSVTSLGSCAFCNNPIDNPSFLYVNGDKSAIRGYIGDLSEFKNKKFIIPPEKDGVPLKTIKSSAFYSMGLSGWEVVIPDSVTTVEGSAFAASGIAKINMPSNLKTVGGSAFYNNKLTELHIPSSVTSIGSLAYNLNSVTNGDIWIYKRTSSGIDYSTIIGYAGANKSNLVIPPEKNGQPLKTINESAFRYLSLTGGITIPPSVTSVGQLAFALNRLSWVDNGDGDKTGPFVYSRNGDGSINKTSLLSYAGYQTANVTIPNNVKRLENYAFYYTYIKGVNIPEGVTYIGSNCFNLCWLEGSVTIPSTVTSIGANAFRKEKTWATNNTNLTKIVNKTGRSFDWKSITGGPEAATFETGTVKNWYGDIQVTK